MPVPAPAMRLVAGQLADELILASQRAEPARLLEEGFTFRFPLLEDALRFELGREDSHRSRVDPSRGIAERQEAA
jgi:NAD dependent epimerase/dehydratase family enzyme